MGASDYMVGNAPQGASYAAPLVGFQLGQQLANLPNAYMQGRENQRTIALQNAFPNGIPQKDDGSPDINAITNTLGKIGGGQYVQQLMPFLLQSAQGQQFAKGAQNINSYVEGGAPNMPPPTTSAPQIAGNATGPANLRPPPQNAPQASGSPQPPQGQEQGMTVMKVLDAQGIPNDQLGAASDSVARQLGVGPNDPIDVNDPRVRNVLGPAIQQLKRAGVGQVVAGPPQAAQPAQQPPQAAPQGAPQPPPTMPGKSPDDVPDVPGMNMETAKRLALGEAYLRQQAMAMAANNPAQAQAIEKQADSYKERRAQILDYLSKQSQTEYEHSLKNQDLTNESKIARDPAVAAYEKTKAQNANDVERFGKQYDAIAKIGDQADETLPQLDLAKRLVNDPNFVSGSLAPGSDMMKRLSVAFGLDPNTATPDQLFDKVRAGSILNQIKGMAGTGPVRVAEMKFIDQMIAGRENTPATLRTLLEIESRLYQRSQAVRDMAHGYNNGHLDNGFDQQVAKYKNDHPLFSKEELKDPRLISPPVFNSPQELARAGLKHGDPFKTADGRIKYVP